MSKAIERIESHLERLNKELAQIKATLPTTQGLPWYRQILGDFTGDEIHAEVVRLGRHIRVGKFKGQWTMPFVLLMSGSALSLCRRTVVNPREYQENRAHFPLSELAKYQGQWVAFSLDGRRVIAGSEDLAALERLVVAGGDDPEQVAYERIELDDVYLGGAELS